MFYKLPFSVVKTDFRTVPTRIIHNSIVGRRQHVISMWIIQRKHLFDIFLETQKSWTSKRSTMLTIHRTYFRRLYWNVIYFYKILSCLLIISDYLKILRNRNKFRDGYVCRSSTTYMNHVKYSTTHIVQRKYLFKIFLKF